MEEFTKKYCRNCEHAEQCCKYTTGYYYEDNLLVKCERYKNWENKRDLELKFRKSGCATNYTFDDYLGDDTSGSLKKVKYIAANPEIFKNAAIYVYGTNGTQKTSMLKILCKKLIERGYSAQFMSLNTLINSLMVSQSFDKEEAILEQKRVESLLDADFLVLDECFDKTKVRLYKSGFQLPALDEFLRQRLEADRKATFFISNEKIETIAEKGYEKSIQDLIQRNVRNNILRFEDNYVQCYNRAGLFDDLFAGMQ